MYSVAIAAPVSFGSFRGGNLIAFASFSPLPLFGFRFECYLMLPGATVQSTLAAQVRVTTLSAEFSASLAAQGESVLDDASQPAWPNAFGVRGLNVHHLGFLASVSLQTGLPNQVGFDAELSLESRSKSMHYTMGLSGIVGAEPSNVLIRVEERNIDQCFFFVLVETLIGDRLPAVNSVERLCAAFVWLKFDYFLFYFSTGASFAALYFPPGGLLEAHVSLFGQYPLLDVSGSINMQSFTASLNGTLHAFDLGPVKVKGKRGQDITVRHSAARDAEGSTGTLQLSSAHSCSCVLS